MRGTEFNLLMILRVYVRVRKGDCPQDGVKLSSQRDDRRTKTILTGRKSESMLLQENRGEAKNTADADDIEVSQ